MAISKREERAAAFFARYGLNVEKIPEGQTQTPDFKVTDPHDFCFYSEVKTMEGPGEDQPLMWNPLYNRFSSNIRGAVDQFNAVNSAHIAPNVLIVLSEEMRIHGKAMADFFEGRIAIEGETIVDLNRQRHGKVKDAIPMIDLFVVLDIADNPTFFFTPTNPHFVDRLRLIFKL